MAALPAAGAKGTDRPPPDRRGVLPGLPLGLPGRGAGAGRAAPRRRRRPVDRHPGRRHPGAAPRRRSPRPVTRPGYPAALGTGGAAHGGGRLAATAGSGCASPTRSAPTRRSIPTVGSKELVALLPTLLGSARWRARSSSRRWPTRPTRWARCSPGWRSGAPTRRRPTPPASSLVWLNSPGNPHGRVLTDDELRAWVAWGRAHGIPVVADECYVTLGWDVEPRSLLHPAIAGDDHTGPARRALAVQAVQRRRLPRRAALR